MSCIEKGTWTCTVSPSPYGTSLRGQILFEDDLSFCRGQSLLPDLNPMGEGTYDGRAEVTVSNFPSGPMTSRPSLVASRLVWTSFPRDLSAQAEGIKRRTRDFLLQISPKELWKSIYQSLQVYIISFLGNPGRGPQRPGHREPACIYPSFAV